MVEPSLLTQLRRESAAVAASARHVRIHTERIGEYAASLPSPAPAGPPLVLEHDQREASAAYWLTLDAINFGSGWFPTLRKPPGSSGYRTISSGLRRRFDAHGHWTPAELRGITREEIAEALGQDPGHDLIGLFRASLNDLGARLAARADGSFAGPAQEAAGSAVQLVEMLASWDCFADVSEHHGRRLPFLKRAQITAADLHRAGVVEFTDLDALTMFADNLVPHVLRLDGILSFSPQLEGAIEREELIEHGSEEEIEIRACAVHAVELIVAASPARTAAQLDELLWNRGQEPRYKARPRHRSRCTAY